MSNNKRRGSDKERRVAQKYRENGCLVIRAGSSIGVADLVVIDPKNKNIFLVQCKILKNGYLRPGEKAKYLKEFEKYSGQYTLNGIIDISKSYKKRAK